MNKYIGYHEIKVNDEVIPVKMGAGALTPFCKTFQINPGDIATLFEVRTFTDKDGNQVDGEVPKEPLEFFANLLMEGANYAARLQGKPQYSIDQAYEWVDDLGVNSEQIFAILKTFILSIRNGGTPVKDIPGQKKSEEPA